MKRLPSLLIAIAVGFLIGYFFRKNPINEPPRPIIEEQITTEDLNSSFAFNNLLVATHLRAGKVDWVHEYLDNQMLPVGVRFFASNRAKIGTRADYYIWRASAYYRDNGLLVPKEISEILANAPATRPNYAGKVAEFINEAPEPLPR